MSAKTSPLAVPSNFVMANAVPDTKDLQCLRSIMDQGVITMFNINRIQKYFQKFSRLNMPTLNAIENCNNKIVNYF